MIDFITVVFRPELFYLQIQARSIEQYVDTNKIGTIFVVVNDQESVCSLVDTAWWGINEGKVKVLWAESLGRTDFLDGWSSQQYYKLATANVAESKWSACLDAKTWFVRTLDFDLLFEQDGRVKFDSFPTIPAFKEAEKSVNDFFGINSKKVIGPGGVPFLFNTNEINQLTSYLMTQKHVELFGYFTKAVQEPTFVTEFMFYSGWIAYKYRDHSALYSKNQYYQVTNIANFQAFEFDHLYTQMSEKNNLTASIHRSVYPKLDDKQFKTWINFLRSKNLIDNFDDHFIKAQLLNTANVE